MQNSGVLKRLRPKKQAQGEDEVNPPLIPTRRITPVPDRIDTYYVARGVLEETHRIIDTHRRYDSEALVFWAGAIAGKRGYVTTCYYPRKAVTRYGGVKVSLAHMTQVNLALAARDQIILCQVHSHPGLALQSDVDEKRAVTFHRGFISVVIPDFDGGKVYRLRECGVYEYLEGRWKSLNSIEVSRRFVIEESLVEV